MSLKKKAPEWWDGLTTDKSYKKFIKADFSKFCEEDDPEYNGDISICLLYTSPSPRDRQKSRMPSSA